MEAFALDILNFFVRWLHLIVGIAWIGSSFYFVMLDTSLEPPKNPKDQDKGVFGEFWAVHGGGFYHSQKYLAGPKNEPLPAHLHWSKWPAYTTFLSGIFLLLIIYWLRAEIYLIDTNLLALTKTQAIAISAGFLLGGWLVYDTLCKLLQERQTLLILLIFLLCCSCAYALTQIFAGRGAYILFGSMLGTIMAANVFFVIIPGQKKMVDAIRAKREVEVAHGLKGKQRSLHNTYFTLPVLFAMLSNHFTSAYAHPQNWLVLILISLVGVFIRIFFVSRHTSKTNFVSLFVALGLLFVSLVVLYLPQIPKQVDSHAGTKIPQAQLPEKAFSLIQQKCTNCHAAVPSMPGFSSAPAGIVLETQEDMQRLAGRIYTVTYVNKSMPIGNITNMTEEQRLVIQLWYESLAEKE